VDKDKLLKTIKKLDKEDKWNHCFELGEGIETIPKKELAHNKAANFNKWQRIKDLVNEKHFINKKILDIGCSDGYFSLKTSKFANKVIGIDIDDKRIKKANFIKSHFNLKNCYFSNQDISEYENEKFDIGLLLGILHRLPDPLSFLKSTSRICDEIIIEYKGMKSKKNLACYGGGQTKTNEFNKLYFLFSPKCLEIILKNLGFEIIGSEKLSYFNKLKFPRHMIHAKKI
tara:strand:+ start:784 stop:1470 length:687 start_codon:yes stop_codon:yes gene_type:complete